MPLGYAGLAVLTASILVFLTRLLLRRAMPTRWSDVGVLVGAGLTAPGLGQDPAWIAPLAAGAAVVWFVATRRELALPAHALRLGPGDPLPDVALEDQRGPLRSRDLPRPALVVLYRGWWCPFCVTQLGELERDHARLAAAGLAVVAISTDPPAEQAALAARLPAVRFVSDRRGELVDAAGVRHVAGVPWYDRLLFGAKQRDLALPVALLVDAAGIIRHARRARRIDERPRVAELIAIFTRARPPS